MFRLFILTIASVCVSLSSALAVNVDRVRVDLTSAQGTMPPLVQKRIAASLETVGNHVFVGHDTAEISGNMAGYDRTVNDIMNRVLVGYTVDAMTITPGPETLMQVKVRPWGNTIQAVHVSFDYGGLPPLGAALAARDAAAAKAQIESILMGLPVDALDWANGPVQAVIEGELEERLPEFYPHIVITGGTTTDVQVYFLPKLPVVRNVHVDVDAENVPKIIFLSTRKNLEERYSGLEGLPVAFVQRHAQDIQGDVTETLAKQWVISQYKLNVTPSLTIGGNTTIHLLSETAFYDIQAGAYMDMSRDHTDHGEDTVLTGLVGRKIGDHHEVYGKIEFMPTTVDWNFIPGYFYRFGKGTRLGYEWQSLDASQHVWLRQSVGQKWYVRVDRDLTHDDGEIGVGYRLDDYVGLEYIASDHDQWLRVIGYL